MAPVNVISMYWWYTKTCSFVSLLSCGNACYGIIILFALITTCMGKHLLLNHYGVSFYCLCFSHLSQSHALSNVIQQFSDLLGEDKTENDDISEPRTRYT